MSSVSSTSIGPTPAEAAIINAERKGKNNSNSKGVRQTDSHPRPDAGKGSEYNSQVSVQVHNQMMKNFAQRFAKQNEENERLRIKLAQKDTEFEVVKHQLQMVRGPDSAREQASEFEAVKHQLQMVLGPDSAREQADELPKSTEGLKGVHRVSMNALIKSTEPIIKSVKNLQQEAAAVVGSIKGVYQNSADFIKFRSGSKSDEELMQDLGIHAVRISINDKEVTKAAPIADGLLAKFQAACSTYTSLVYNVNKCLNELLVVEQDGNLKTLDSATLDMVSRVMLFRPEEWEPAAKQHLDMYKKLCDMRNTLQLDKNAIDDDLVNARSNGNWIVDRHYTGIGIPYPERNDKIFKFVPIFDQVPPTQDAPKS